MPNWCANKLELIGPKELVFQFAKRWNDEIENGSGVGVAPRQFDGVR